MAKYDVKSEEAIPGVRVLTAKTGVRNVVTIEGSLPAGERFAESNVAVPFMTAAMLTEGSKKYSKEEIHAKLEQAGITLSFEVDENYLRFRARCMKGYLGEALEMIAELLAAPTFKSSELGIIVKNRVGALMAEKESTRAQAERAFLRETFSKGHPHYAPTFDEEITATSQVTTGHLKKFHKNFVGRGALTLAIAGDIDRALINRVVESDFKRLKVLVNPLVPEQSASLKKAKAKVRMPDKASSDIYIGQAVTVARHSPEFYALSVALFALGGDFLGRLMMNVRDKKGLTYGTYSRLRGLSIGDDGYWFMWGTFAPSLLSKGERAMMEELNRLYKKGISRAELKEKQETITGQFVVELADSRGFARSLLALAEGGLDLEYLNEYPKIIKSVKLADVNKAIKTFIDPTELVNARAGS